LACRAAGVNCGRWRGFYGPSLNRLLPYIVGQSRAARLLARRFGRNGDAMQTNRWQMMADKPKTDGDASVITKTKPKTQRPPMYKVLLLNDDYTPMEFVVHVLERFFGIGHSHAVEIMLTVHKKGVAVVGVFSYEIAETKVAQVMDFARRNQHPLQCTMEKED
jgi:ATP-dependent Clp protease adaptor protein ClpS